MGRRRFEREFKIETVHHLVDAGARREVVSEENWLALQTQADSLQGMRNPRIFRYFKTSPEIIRLAAMT